MRGKDSRFFNITFIRNTRTVCEADIHKAMENLKKEYCCNCSISYGDDNSISLHGFNHAQNRR